MSEDAEKKRWMKALYGKFYEKATRNFNKAQQDSKSKFQIDHPLADTDKFWFLVTLSDEGDLQRVATMYRVTEKQSFDITSETFRELYSHALEGKWGPIIWGKSSTVSTLSLRDSATLPFDVTAFKVYVSENDYFKSNFEKLNTSWKNGQNLKDIRKAAFSVDEPYFASLLAAYIISWKGGVCLEHFQDKKNTPKVLTSLAKFYVYFHMKRFLKVPSRLNSYLTKDERALVRKAIPTKKVWKSSFHQGKENIGTWLAAQPNRHDIRKARYVMGNFGGVVGIRYEEVDKVVNQSDDDWMKFIRTKSDGLSSTGQLLIQRAAESYAYSALGSQAQTYWTIVGAGAKSLQTQKIFNTIVKDTVIQDNDAVAISNMRTAIQNTNVILNLVISPGIILIPSKMIILKKKIDGYNNVLTLATERMRFGVNPGLNRTGIASPEEKINLPSKPSITPEKNVTVYNTLKSTENHSEVLAAVGSALGIFAVVKYFFRTLIKMSVTVYILFLKGARNSPTNKYVGCTEASLKKRLSQHKSVCTSDYRKMSSRKLYRAMCETGRDNWEIEPLAKLSSPTKEERDTLEMFYIQHLNADLNTMKKVNWKRRHAVSV